MLGEDGVVVEGGGLAHGGSILPKTTSMTEMASAAVLPVSRAASVTCQRRRDFASAGRSKSASGCAGVSYPARCLPAGGDRRSIHDCLLRHNVRNGPRPDAATRASSRDRPGCRRDWRDQARWRAPAATAWARSIKAFGGAPLDLVAERLQINDPIGSTRTSSNNPSISFSIKARTRSSRPPAPGVSHSRFKRSMFTASTPNYGHRSLLVFWFFFTMPIPAASGAPSSMPPRDLRASCSSGTARRHWHCGARCNPRSPRCTRRAS